MPGESIPSQLASPTTKITEIIYAPQLLHGNVAELTAQRRRVRDPRDDIVTPTLAAATATHNFVFARSFRPCVLVASEYVTVTGCGNGSCGTKTIFNPKSNPDYHNDGYFMWRLPSVTCSLANLPHIVVYPANDDIATSNSNIPFDFGTGAPADAANQRLIMVRDGFNYTYTGGAPVATLLPSDGVNYVLNPANLKGGIRYTYVTGAGTFIADAAGKPFQPLATGMPNTAAAGYAAAAVVQRRNYVRAADFLGAKLHKKSTYKVDDNVIEEYTDINILTMRELFMARYGTQMAFDRLIGQEVPESKPGKALYSRVGQSASRLGEGGLNSSTIRAYTHFANGLQTPKEIQPATDIYVPGLFYHMRCKENAMPVCLFPDANICYEIETAPLAELYHAVEGDTFILEEVYAERLDTAVAPALIPTLAPTTRDNMALYHSRMIPVKIPGSVPVFEEENLCPELVLGSYYLEDVLHVCLMSRVYYAMIRSWTDITTCKITPDCPDMNYELTGLRYPAELIVLHESPYTNGANTLSTAVDPAEDWWVNGEIRKENVPLTTYVQMTYRTGNALAPLEFILERTQIQHNQINKVYPLIDRLGVKVYDTEYHPLRKRVFYNDYTKFTYGSGILYSGESPNGQLMVNFTQYINWDSPSSFGVVSASRNRYISLVIDSTPQPDMPAFVLRDGIQGPLTTVRSDKVKLTAQVLKINFVHGAGGQCYIRFQ